MKQTAKSKSIEKLDKTEKLVKEKTKKLSVALWIVSILVILIIGLFVYNKYEENQNQKLYQEQKIEEARQEMRNVVEPNVPSVPQTQETNAQEQVQKNAAANQDMSKCTVDEARNLVKGFLVSEDSPAYLVTKIQNFAVLTFVDSYGKPKNCKLYAPTKEQFKSFLSNRKYVTFQLTKSTVFVDDGEHKLTDAEIYELTRKANIQKIMIQLIDDYPEGTSVKFIRNDSIENKQSW
jgi:hypothetical protein